MSRGEIPGFWYDEAKGKYFKILPNHVAPQGACYSKEGVKKRMVEDVAEAERAALHGLQHRTQVKRASIFKDPYASLVLNRQTGLLSPQVHANPGSIWAHHATIRQFLDIHKEERPRRTQYRGTTKCEHVVTAVAKDQATGTIFQAYYGKNYRDGGTVVCIESWLPRHVQGQEDEYPTSSRRPLSLRRDTEVSSLCLSPDRKLCSTTLNGTLSVMSLLPPETIADSTYPNVDSDFHLNINYEHTIWSSHCNSASILAVGSSRGMHVFSLDTELWCPISLKDSKDTLAVRWSSTHILLGGTRKGTVWQSDQRVPATSRLLRHPSPVTGLRMLDEHRIVVSGPNHQLLAYDRRFLRTLPVTAWQKRTRTSSGPDSGHRAPVTPRQISVATAPYIEYRGFGNAAHTNLGFDVSKDLALVAAATDGGKVKVWDGWTGRERVWGRGCYEEEDQKEREGDQDGEPQEGDEKGGQGGRRNKKNEPKASANEEGKDLVRSLQFTGGGHGESRGEALLMARGDVVEEWGW